MARAFDSTAYLDAATAIASGAPVAMACRFRANSLTANGALVALSNDTNDLDRLQLINFGAAPSDPVRAFSQDSTSLSFASTSVGYSVGVWQSAFALFKASNFRQVWLDGANSVGPDTTNRSPAGLNHTTIGGTVSFSSNLNPFDGDIAEAAIWAGSNVANMGRREAALLASGLSPLALREYLPELVMYQDLIRPLNRPGIGPAMSDTNTTVAPHPRVFNPSKQLLTFVMRIPVDAPYRLSAAMIDAGVTQQAMAATTGAAQGATSLIGEVSS